MSRPPQEPSPETGRPECPIVVDRLPAFAAGGVPDAEALLIEAHIEGCGRCRAEHAAFLQVTAAIGDEAWFDDQDLGRANMALAEALDRTAPRLRRNYRLTVAAAAAVLLAAVGFVVNSPPQVTLSDLGAVTQAFARVISLPTPRIDAMTLQMPTGAGLVPGRSKQ